MTVKVCFGAESREVSALSFCQACEKYTRETLPNLVRVSSPVSRAHVDKFLSYVENRDIKIKCFDVSGLQMLCSEFGCRSLEGQLANDECLTQLARHAQAIESLERARVEHLERIAAQERMIADVQNECRRAISVQEREMAETLANLRRDLAVLRTEMDSTNRDNSKLRADLSSHVNASKRDVTDELAELKRQLQASFQQSQSDAIEGLRSEIALRIPLFESKIVRVFPEIFDEFRTCRFELLWRGTRDGFNGEEFHRRCDGHKNTLTLIMAKDGNIFGGFTPTSWESRVWNKQGGANDNCRKADESLKSFLFTLKNTRGISPRRFPLEDPTHAIRCNSCTGPAFGVELLFVHDGILRRVKVNGWDPAYKNDTGIDMSDFFPRPEDYTPEEIEVFELKV
jgi:hypothetical protein